MYLNKYQLPDTLIRISMSNGSRYRDITRRFNVTIFQSSLDYVIGHYHSLSIAIICLKKLKQLYVSNKNWNKTNICIYHKLQLDLNRKYSYNKNT